MNRPLALLLVAACALGCKRGAPPAVKAAPPAATDVAPAAIAPAPKKPRWNESAVYVDGKAVGILRALELPPGFGPIVTHVQGFEIRRYGMLSYLRALGVPVEKVREVHVYGGKRVVGIAGDSFRGAGDRFRFSFTGGDRGKTRLHWASELRVPIKLDMMTGLAVYIDKTPPSVHEEGGMSFVSFGDGKEVEGVPYATDAQGTGTRVYVDGKLAHTLKRKALPASAITSTGESGSRYALASVLAGSGVDLGKAKAVDLIRGDDVVSRVNEEVSQLSFVLPAKNQGKGLFEVPRAEGTGTVKTKVTAIQLYVLSKPPARTVTPPSEDEPFGTAGGAEGPNEESL